MSGRKHHYLPQLIQRPFADSDRFGTAVWRKPVQRSGRSRYGSLIQAGTVLRVMECDRARTITSSRARAQAAFFFLIDSPLSSIL